jgi:hypothetical protein
MRKQDWLSRGLAIALCSMALTACQVEQEREGQMPDVEVDADPGRWPSYDVAWADVDVGTDRRTVTVPVVSVTRETREITVPYIDINPPGSGDREEQTIVLEVEVPHAGYNLEITEVRAAQDDLWVVGRLTATDTPAAQVATRVMDQVVVRAPEDLDVREVIVGDRPDGSYNQQHRFVDSTQALDQMIPSGARVVYRRAGA